MHVGWIKIGCSGVRVKSIACLVVARLILARRQLHISPEQHDKRRLTKVPRSYQTSEMFGFSLIAREYASRASRYWLIW